MFSETTKRAIKKIRKIITHQGKAHLDDFLAVGLLAYLKQKLGGSYVSTNKLLERRNPNNKELKRPSCWVIDVGGQHDQDRHNFDHHQMDGLECAFSLVVKYLGIEHLFAGEDWYEDMILRDCRGPKALADKYGIRVNPTMFPILNNTVLDLASKDNATFVRLAREVAGHIFEQALEKHRNKEKLRKLIDVQKFGDCDVVFVETDNILGLEDVLQEMGIQPAARVTHDNRGDGYALYRYNDHPSVDFRRLDGMEEILFVHKAGFIAKTKDKNVDTTLLMAIACGDQEELREIFESSLHLLASRKYWSEYGEEAVEEALEELEDQKRLLPWQENPDYRIESDPYKLVEEWFKEIDGELSQYIEEIYERGTREAELDLGASIHAWERDRL